MRKLSPLYVIGLATLSGVTSGLAVHSDHFWVFGIIGLTGLMAAWRCAGNARTALFAGWAGGFAYFAASLEFLLAGYHSIGMSGLQPLFGVSALYALLCIWWGPVFYISHRIERWTGIFGLVFLWFGSELLRAFIAPAIPPSFFGDFWSKTPVIQAVSVIGIEGLSFVTLLAAGLVCRDLGRKPFPIVPILIFAVLWKAGADIEAGPSAQFNGPLVATINTDLAQDQRWNPAILDDYITDLASRSQSAWQDGADIVLWPENATPYFLEEKQAISAAFPPDGKFLIHGSTIIADMTTAQAFNGLAVTDSTGGTIATYHKAYLFPFAEYIPFEATVRGLFGVGTISTPSIATGGYRRGEALSEPMRLLGTGIIPNICYEGLVPIRTSTDARTWILNMANDAWWVGTAGGGYIAAASRVRAIERGVPMIRVSNAGPSFMVDALGRDVRPSSAGFYQLP